MWDKRVFFGFRGEWDETEYASHLGKVLLRQEGGELRSKQTIDFNNSAG